MKFGSKKAIFGLIWGVLRGLDHVWESATPPTHILEKLRFLQNSENIDFIVACGNKITVLYGCGFGFKKLGLGQTLSPLVGTKSQLLFNFFKRLPFNRL